jgi:hypothetical protein
LPAWSALIVPGAPGLSDGAAFTPRAPWRNHYGPVTGVFPRAVSIN